MEEKGYPHIDEEEDVGMCCEPIADAVVDTSVRTTKLADGSTLVHDWIDDLDWDRFPSYGPFSEEEAIARIQKAKDNLKNPTKRIRIDDLHAELKKLHPWL
jgi:hypothetical protein